MPKKDQCLDAEAIAVLESLGRLAGAGVMSFSEATAYGSRFIISRSAIGGISAVDLEQVIDEGMQLVESAAFAHVRVGLEDPERENLRGDTPDRAALMHAVAGRSAAVWAPDGKIIFDTDLRAAGRPIPISLSLNEDLVEITDGGQIFQIYQKSYMNRLSYNDLAIGYRSALDHNGFHLDDDLHIVARYDADRSNYDVFVALVKSTIADFIRGVSLAMNQFDRYLDQRLRAPFRIDMDP